MKNLKLYFSTFLLILFTQLSFAGGGGSIKGNIIDPADGGVIGANVYFYEGGVLRGDVTDIDGKFNIKAIRPGSYDLFITSVGFDTLKLKGVRVIGDRITMLRNQQLSFKTLGVFIVEEIIWEVPLISIEEPIVTIFDAKSIERIAGRGDINSMIGMLTPGVYQKEPGDPLQMRGSRGGASTYFIDGVKAEGISSNFPSASIGTIRVFTGGVPAMYGDVVGGIVVIETKSFMSWYNEASR